MHFARCCCWHRPKILLTHSLAGTSSVHLAHFLLNPTIGYGRKFLCRTSKHSKWVMVGCLSGLAVSISVENETVCFSQSHTRFPSFSSPLHLFSFIFFSFLQLYRTNSKEHCRPVGRWFIRSDGHAIHQKLLCFFVGFARHVNTDQWTLGIFWLNVKL